MTMAQEDLEYDRECMQKFWEFVHERQSIWYRRNVLHQEPPWTKDRILQQYKFTNVYRILDTGTQFLLREIVRDKHSNLRKNHREILLNTILYRVFNRIGTYQQFGYQTLEGFDSKKICSAIKDYRSRGNPPFTSAFMVTGAVRTPFECHDKVEMYCWVVQEVYDNLQRLLTALQEAKDMETAHKILASCKGIGSFLAYQIMLDLMYAKVLPFHEDEWSIGGLGASRGLRYIFPSLKKKDELATMRYLHQNQEMFFQSYNLDFPYFDGIRISLSNVENTTCEFSKYMKTLLGKGRPRVLFKPRGVKE